MRLFPSEEERVLVRLSCGGGEANGSKPGSSWCASGRCASGREASSAFGLFAAMGVDEAVE